MIFLLQIFFSFGFVFARDVEFSWIPSEGVTKYEIQVAGDKEFKKIIKEGASETASFTAQLGVGRHYYRVRVVDKKGRGGLWSKPSSVLISPLSPELVSPEIGFQTSYYEILPKMDFTWKSVPDGENYEVLITTPQGATVLQEKAKGTSFSTQNLPFGQYIWKVRTLGQDQFVSGFSEPRTFEIKKKEFTTPELIVPEDEGYEAAYRPLNFQWRKDPAAKLTDVYYEKIGKVEKENTTRKFENLGSQDHSLEYEEPGKYNWYVVTKEAEKTPGVKSLRNSFEVRNDVPSAGNYELEFSMSQASDQFDTKSNRQSGGSTTVSSSATSSQSVTGFSAGYYLGQPFGVFLSTRTAKSSLGNQDFYQQESELTFRLRMGAAGFFQDMLFGARVMDLPLVETSPAVRTNVFTSLGPVVGTRLSGTFSQKIRVQLQAYYFKPFSNMEGINGVTVDAYGGSFGVKWNFFYEFWLGARYSLLNVTGKFQPAGSSANATWTQSRSEPIFLSLSYEH